MPSLMELVLRDEPVEKAPDDLRTLAFVAQHEEWLKHPNTRNFIEWLAAKLQSHHDNLLSSCELMDAVELKQKLIVEKQIKEILDYVQTPANG